MIRVLFFSAKPFELETFKKLKSNYKEIEITPVESSLNFNTAKLCQGYQAICCFVTDKLDSDCLQAIHAAGVKLIALRSAGFNHVDLKTAEELKLTIVRVPAYSPEAIAEFSVGLYLSLNRKIHRAHTRIHDGNFSLSGLVGRNVNKQTIGVIGTGNIGKCTAQIYRGFGSQVIAYDLKPNTEWSQKNGIQYCDLDFLLQNSDVITLHIPLNSSNLHFLNAAAFAKLKKNCYLINTSRGGLIETKALISALKKHQLAGAALDVYEEEEGIFFEDHSNDMIDDDLLARLTTFPNVLITSHQAFLTEEALTEIAHSTLQNILDWSTGAKLPNQVRAVAANS